MQDGGVLHILLEGWDPTVQALIAHSTFQSVMHQSYISAIATLSLVLLTGVTAQKCPVIAPAFEPTFAEGYSGRVVVNGLKYPRSMVLDRKSGV